MQKTFATVSAKSPKVQVSFGLQIYCRPNDKLREVVGAFIWLEGIEKVCDTIPEVLNGALGGLP